MWGTAGEARMTTWGMFSHLFLHIDMPVMVDGQGHAYTSFVQTLVQSRRPAKRDEW